MVEKVLERGREPEPEESPSEAIYNYKEDFRRRRSQGKVVVKGNEQPWFQSRQGLLKHLVHIKNWEELGVPFWNIFVHHIRNHSGRHRHQGGLGLFVLEGKGYTVVDGVRYDWEKDDLILLPVAPGGCEHQHFNLDPGKASQWLAFIFQPFSDAQGNILDQKENSPEYSGADQRVTPPSPHRW